VLWTADTKPVRSADRGRQLHRAVAPLEAAFPWHGADLRYRRRAPGLAGKGRMRPDPLSVFSRSPPFRSERFWPEAARLSSRPPGFRLQLHTRYRARTV